MQQLAKQEAPPEVSEQNVAEEDDEQGNNVIKDQLFDDEFKDSLTRLSKDQLSTLYELRNVDTKDQLFEMFCREDFR